MLYNIQVLRALAAFMVVFVHLEALAERAGAGAGAFTFGNGGVDLFFVISGFIMVFTTARRPSGPVDFMTNRVVRIVPLYWLITLSVWVIAFFAPTLMQATRADLGELAKSLTFVPYLKSNGLAQPVAFVGWTLNYEMAFYALFAASLLIRSRVMAISLVVGALAAVTTAGQLIRPTSTLGIFYTQPIIVEFALGMIIGALHARLPHRRPAQIAAAMLIGPALLLMILGPQLWGDGVDRLFMFGLPGAVVVSCALVLERGGRVLSTRILKLLGDASYAIYLSHFFVTQAVVKVVERFELAGAPLMALAAVVALILVAIVGVAVHWTVERPMTAVARRLLRGSGRMRQAPA